MAEKESIATRFPAHELIEGASINIKEVAEKGL